MATTLEVLQKLRDIFQQHVHELEGTNCDNSIAIRNSGIECCIKFVDEEIEAAKESNDKIFGIIDYMHEKFNELLGITKNLNNLEYEMKYDGLPPVLEILDHEYQNLYDEKKSWSIFHEYLLGLEKYYELWELTVSKIEEKILNGYYVFDDKDRIKLSELHDAFIDKSHMILYCLNGMTKKEYKNNVDVSTQSIRDEVNKLLGIVE